MTEHCSLELIQLTVHFALFAGARYSHALVTSLMAFLQNSITNKHKKPPLEIRLQTFTYLFLTTA